MRRQTRRWLSGGTFCVALVAGGCGQRPEGVDLIRSSRVRLAESSVAWLDPQALQADLGKPRRIHNVVRASIPATPPSRFRFLADVPPDGRLVLAAGIPGRYREASAVEFLVSVRHGGREQTLLSRLVDPANREADRGWVPLEADLSGHAGRSVEIVLETRGFEQSEATDRAFWGTPTITTARDARAPLVVVYLVDTLRADHLPLYGYSRDTAPELTRFAQEAVVFDQAIAAASWTKPSVASLFTSLLPREHQCVRFCTPLDPGLVTLAERLQQAGYGTGAVVVNPHVGAKNMQLDQGFDQFVALPVGRPAGPVVNEGLAFVDARRGQPTFLYVHTMDAHAPYRPPSPFDRRYPPFPEPGRDAARPFGDYQEPADRDRIVGQYDGAIAYGDREFGRFVRGLRERGLFESATIVFLSDHGEEFLDHGGWDHGRALFDELVRVPLVVKYPRGLEAGRRVARQVQLVDVLPTILKSQGLPVPGGIVGRPLDESFGATGPERPAVFETSYFEHEAYGVRTSEAKYVRRFYPASAELFFDLRHDPGERQGLDAGGSSLAQALKSVAEASLSSIHRRLVVDGTDDCDLRLRTTGWLQIVDRVGLLASEEARVADGGQALVLRLEGQARRAGRVEIAFVTRPRGAPLWIEGTRAGRPLRASDIRVGEKGVGDPKPLFLVPNEVELAVAFGPLASAIPGAPVSLVLPRDGRTATLDPETAESLKALGYVR